MREILYRAAKAWRNYRRPATLAAERLLKTRTVTVDDRRTGLRFRCLAGADRMFAEVFHSRHYDVPLAPVGPGDLVLDVGANHGFAACYLGHLGAEVLAFEPSPTVFPYLKLNIEANGLAASVRPLQEAVTDREGTVTLRETAALGGGMSTVDEGFARRSGASYAGEHRVSSRSLRRVLEDLGPRRVRLLKLDCEGSELGILGSLGPGHRERIDAVALEAHAAAYPLTELLDLLLEWDGFHLSKLQELDTANAVFHLVSAEAIRRWVEGRTGG